MDKFNSYAERRKQHRRLDNMLAYITTNLSFFMIVGMFKVMPELEDPPNRVRFTLILLYMLATFVAYLRVGRAYSFADSENELRR